MTKSATLSVNDGNIREAVNNFLKDLFAKEVIEAILVPLTHPAETNVVQALVTNPDYLDKADVFAPVMPVNSGRIIQSMTRLAPVTKKTAVVIRPCEMRAVVELVKLKQIQLDDLLLIGIDCPGAYSVKDYPKFAAEKKSDDFVKAGFKFTEDSMLRAGCQICEYPYPLTTDITIGLLGLDPGKQMLIQAGSAKGEEALGKSGMELEDDSEAAKKRQAAIEKFDAEVKDRRKKFFEERNYSEAMIEFDRALAITPNNPKIIKAKNQTIFKQMVEQVEEHSNRAMHLLEIGDIESARDEYRMILTIIPNGANHKSK